MSSLNNKFKGAFESFKEKTEIHVDRSTTAFYGGRLYTVELFQDGTYKICSNAEENEKGKGLVIAVPVLQKEDDSDFPDLISYAVAIAQLEERYLEACRLHDSAINE